MRFTDSVEVRVTPLPETPDRRIPTSVIADVSTFEFDHLQFTSSFASARGMSKYLAIYTILLFCQLAAAQFGFFEQMFQGDHPGRQQQRQRPPGADHWRAQVDASKSLPTRTGDTSHTFLVTSSLLYVPLPRYPRMCGRTRSVPLSERGGHQMCNPRCPR